MLLMYVIVVLCVVFDQYFVEGGQLVCGVCYVDNCWMLVELMCVFGFVLFFDVSVQVLVIVMFYVFDYLVYDFCCFYDVVCDVGFILYLGKLMWFEMFCVGCIGVIDVGDIWWVVVVIGVVVELFGIVMQFV